MVYEYLSDGQEKTQQIAFDFCHNFNIDGPVIVLLCGDLGAGKTTFMKGVGSFFGVKEEIISPTFLIQKKYLITKNNERLKNLIHIDAYRIENERELKTIAWENFSTNSENIIFIEWPEKMNTEIKYNFKIDFFHIEENKRKILIYQNEKSK